MLFNRIYYFLFVERFNKKLRFEFPPDIYRWDLIQRIIDKYNSLKILKKNGFILVHDCLPRSLAQQAVPRYRASWNGDVWKAIVELRTKNNLNIFTSQIDFGVAIIQISENKKQLKLDINNFSKLKFKDYYYNHKEFMNILDYEETLNKI